jgi:hypothetical protein
MSLRPLGSSASSAVQALAVFTAGHLKYAEDCKTRDGGYFRYLVTLSFVAPTVDLIE